MQEALLQSLGRWPGRPVIQATLERRGFLLHRKWQERIIQFCGNGTTELDRYWDECASEWICCAGRANPNARTFSVGPSYRSAYLDGLAAKVDFAEPPYRFPALLKDLYEYKKAFKDRSFVENERKHFETLKQQEFEKFSISSEGMTDQKRSILPFVEKFSVARGFAARKRQFVKKSLDLIFEIKSDFGWNPLLGAGLPLNFRIFHKTAPDFALVTASFDPIVPGFCRYEYCPSPDGCVLAIFASVELFDVLFHALGRSDDQ